MVMAMGGGIFPQTEHAFKMAFGFYNNMKVLYVPFARRSDNYDSCYDFICQEMNYCEVKSITMLEKKDYYRYEDYEEFNTIYIGGGDVFELLEFINSTNFGDVIRGFNKDRKMIIGSSAGAIVLGKDPKMYRTVSVSLNNYNGLNLCGDYSFVCHYVENGYYKKYSSKEIREKILNYINENDASVFALPENAAIIFDELGNIISYTKNNVYLYQKKVM